jgi:CRISPR system Cascade subunit CasE
MTQFNLMHCQPDPRKLMPWASRHGWLPAGGDPGYALHVALHEAFGDLAPKPFAYRDGRDGLLAYTASSADELREAASLARPDLAAALGLDAGAHGPGLGVHPFPCQWSAGRVLGFEVRVRPMRRKGKDKNKNPEHKTRELDAYQSAIEREPAAKERIVREDVYREWLAREFTASGAASMVAARMTRFQLTKVFLRTQGLTGAERKPRDVIGPDVTFAGHLQIEEPDAFARLLARGIGRHRSFGFGMLLLRPASTGV